MLKASLECWKAISELNGYLKAVKEDFSPAELKLLHICEAKYALEIEGSNIAFVRLFEAYASENNLNEPIAKLIFEMANISQNLKQTNTIALSHNFPFLQRSKKSNFQIPLLKREVNTYLTEPFTTDALLYLGLLYGFLLMQKNEFKNQLFFANALVNNWLKEYNLLQLPLLPIAMIIKSEIKEANEITKEAYETGGMQRWILYFLNIIQTAAQARLLQFQYLVQLKQTTRVNIAKYTSYNLPENELMELLFENPFIKAKDLIIRMNCHRQTAYAYLMHLEMAGILIEKKSGREKLYFHKKLFEILISS